MTAQRKEALVDINRFINNFEGELTVRVDGVYHKNKLVAKFKDGVSHFYIEKL